jgi:hypothetical protein
VQETRPNHRSIFDLIETDYGVKVVIRNRTSRQSEIAAIDEIDDIVVPVLKFLKHSLILYFACLLAVEFDILKDQDKIWAFK